MRNFYIIFLLNFCVFFTNAQDLEWTTPAPTGTGNESIAVLAGSVALGGDVVTQTGSLVGVFYINDNGGYTCGGYTVLDDSYMGGGNVAISAWGADAGEDNTCANRLHPKISNPNNFKIIKENVNITGFKEIKKNISLLFIDPPYIFNNFNKLLTTIINADILLDNSIIIIETHKSTKVELLGSMHKIDERIYGITKITFILFKY